ncbi:MAG: M36 family metallopeptidase [Sandaracinaceae bacterium]|nr:M36 family metallopeptidase [Sandaracinaceae bacterium]
MARSLAWTAAILLASSPLIAHAQLRGGGAFDAYATPSAVAPAARSAPTGLLVTSTDTRRGVPTMMVGRRAARAGLRTTAERALDHAASLAPLYGVGARDLGTVHVVLTRATPAGGAVVVLGQRVAGLEVFETQLTLLLDRTGALVAAGGQLRPTPATVSFARTHQSSIQVALGDAIGAADPLRFDHTGRDGYQRWTGSAALDRPIRAKRILYPLPAELVPAHYVEVWSGGELIAYAIAADDGRILMRRHLTAADAFEYLVYVDPASPLERLQDSPFGDTSPDRAGMPVETLPPFVDQVRVMVESLDGAGPTNPWLAAGATETFGNNVDAYTDLMEPDGLSEGDFRAMVTAPGVFAHPFDPARSPIEDDTQLQAAITHLFFVNNWLHDWWYGLGFDEAAGNAQAMNFGRGGEEEDPLHAEAADYSRRNNANMSTPRDGDSPRMQMFLWDGLDTRSFESGGTTYRIGVARFGPFLYDVTGPLVLADDGVDPPNDACSDLVNDVTGAIVLIDRGDCSFVSKVQRAEAAGAIGVIIMNDDAGDMRINMSGSGPTDIGSMMVSLEDGAILRAATGATGRMRREARPDVGSSLDTQVVSHEWGHYLHHRLVACGSPQCDAQSEGWGDFVAALVLMRPGDDLDAAYPSASFSNQGREAIYFGTRRLPYSVNRAFNDLSFRHITDDEPLPTGPPLDETTLPNSEVHNAGEVWASMMFDAMIGMLRRSGEAGAPYDFDGARRALGGYVVTGMQLAPRDPTYTEQRDAIVAAALENDPEDARLIAEAFAARGAGTCATSPERYSEDFVGVTEDFGVAALPRIEELEVVLDGGRRLCDADRYLDAGETGWVRIVVRNVGVVDLVGATLALEPDDLGVSVDEPERTLADVAPGQSVELWAELTAGEMDLRGGPMDVRATVTAATGCGVDTRTARVAIDRDPGVSLLEDFEIIPTWLNEVSVDGTTTDVWSVGPSNLGDEDWVLRGAASGFLSDTATEVPEVNVLVGIPFVLRFDHRFDFEANDDTLFDGGVIELSTDGGMSWQDVSDLIDPGYTGELTDRSMNPLALRAAYSAPKPVVPRRGHGAARLRHRARRPDGALPLPHRDRPVGGLRGLGDRRPRADRRGSAALPQPRGRHDRLRGRAHRGRRRGPGRDRGRSRDARRQRELGSRRRPAHVRVDGARSRPSALGSRERDADLHVAGARPDAGPAPVPAARRGRQRRERDRRRDGDGDARRHRAAPRRGPPDPGRRPSPSDARRRGDGHRRRRAGHAGRRWVRVRGGPTGRPDPALSARAGAPRARASSTPLSPRRAPRRRSARPPSSSGGRSARARRARAGRTRARTRPRGLDALGTHARSTTRGRRARGHRATTCRRR